MTAEQITTIVVGLCQVTGLGAFFYHYIRGLKKTIETQKQTLEVMERRILETEKIGTAWKMFLHDLPAELELYKQVTSTMKDEAIKELQQANAAKDQKLKEAAETKVKDIADREKLLNDLPAALQKLNEKLDALDIDKVLASRELSQYRRVSRWSFYRQLRASDNHPALRGFLHDAPNAHWLDE